jgi:hypothetical protein
LCHSVVEEHQASPRRLVFKNKRNPNTVQSEVEFDEVSDLVDSEFEMYGYDAFLLGGVDKSCFCGWVLTSTGQCIVPSVICEARGGNCTFEQGSEEFHAFTDSLVDDWSTDGSWLCPENDLSDSWGIVPLEDIDRWIVAHDQDLNTRVAHLLRLGMSGLRVGNTHSLGLQARKEGVHPGTRREKLRSGSNSISLKKCESDILHSFDAGSVVDEVVDDLFPMAQGIHDSLPISVCLRFTIEYLRLRVMIMISGIKDMQNLIDQQTPVTDLWKTR